MLTTSDSAKALQSLPVKRRAMWRLDSDGLPELVGGRGGVALVLDQFPDSIDAARLSLGIDQLDDARREFQGLKATKGVEAAKAMWARRVDAWRKGPFQMLVPVAPAPAPSAAEIEKLVAERAAAEVAKRLAEMPVDEAALLARGERIGAAKALLLPRVEAAIQWIDDQQCGRGGAKPSGIDALIEATPVTGGWLFTPKFIDELVEIEEVLPELGTKLRTRADGCEIVAFTHDFGPIVEAAKVKLMPKDKRPVTSDQVEAWFHLENDILHGHVVFAAEVAVRDAKGPFRHDPVVQDRAVAATELLRLNEMLERERKLTIPFTEICVSRRGGPQY